VWDFGHTSIPSAERSAAIKREEEKIVLAVAIQAVAGELPIFAPKIAVMSGRMMAAAGAGGGGVIRT
jgi:hypothetical protein